MDTEVDWGTEDDFDPWAAGTSTSVAATVENSDAAEKTMVDSEAEQPVASKPAPLSEVAEQEKKTTQPASQQQPLSSTEAQPLPPDWIIKTSRKDSSKTYYYNTVTKEVSWTRPVPEEPEPETPPLPDQELPLVQPIEGQGSMLEAEASPAQAFATDDNKAVPVSSGSSVTSPIQVDASEISTGQQLEERGVTPASPEVNEGPSLNLASTARTEKIGGQGPNSGKRRRGGAGGNRRDKSDWRMRERRERAGAPFRGGLPSQTAHHQRAMSPPPRSSIGEVRRRDGHEEIAEDRGVNKRPRVEPPNASTGGETQPQRFAALSQSTLSDSIGRADGRDQRAAPNRNPELQGPRAPSFLSGVNAIPTTRKMGGAIPPETLNQDLQRGPASSSMLPSIDRVAGPSQSARHVSPPRPEPRSEERSYRERESYRPGPDASGRDREYARAVSTRDVPPHREVANSSQAMRTDAYGNRDRYADMARPGDPRDYGRAADGHRDVQRGDPSQDLRRRSPSRDVPGRRDAAMKETGQNDRRHDIDPRAPFPARADGRSLPDRRSPPPHSERNRDGRYTPDVRSARSVDESRSRGHAGGGEHFERQPASGQTNKTADSAAPIQPATSRAVPFVHPSRLPALGAAAGSTLPAPQPQRNHTLGRPPLQDPREQMASQGRRPPAVQGRAIASSSVNTIPVNGRAMNPPLSRPGVGRNGHDRAGEEARFAASAPRSEPTRGQATPDGGYNTPGHPGSGSRRHEPARTDRRFARP